MKLHKTVMTMAGLLATGIEVVATYGDKAILSNGTNRMEIRASRTIETHYYNIDGRAYNPSTGNVFSLTRYLT